MAIKKHIASAAESREDKLYREERNFRADKLVEKWSRVPEIGKGIREMDATQARNLAILLENQTRQMSRMNEAQLSNNFFNFTPENMLRLVRLSYPNSIRGSLFTEFAMETSHDSIKYVEPIYTNAMRDAFDIMPYGNGQSAFGPGAGYDMNNRFDDVAHNRDVMYESTESRYATEIVNVPAENVDATGDKKLYVKFAGGALDLKYIPTSSVIYCVGDDGLRNAIAMQDEKGNWFGGKDIFAGDNDVYVKIDSVVEANGEAIATILCKNGISGAYAVPDAIAKVTASADPHFGQFKITVAGAGDIYVSFKAVGRFDSEKDLTGKYLGEVELQMRDYHFRPRPITLGVTWTELTELVLDTSFGVSAEEMLMDSAAQEIKKTLDFQAVKYASDVQKTYASDNFVQFDAQFNSVGAGAKDSYWHQAQLINQAIGHVEDNMLNTFNRGGVTAIVGGPKACRYLELNEGWSNKGAQPKIGGHKVGELNGIPVFKVPANIIPDNELVTTWKNENAEGDVAIAIGTLMPFYSTGALQRKNLYKEACVARFEDTQALQPKYLGRVQIKNIQ